MLSLEMLTTYVFWFATLNFRLDILFWFKKILNEENSNIMGSKPWTLKPF